MAGTPGVRAGPCCWSPSPARRGGPCACWEGAGMHPGFPGSRGLPSTPTAVWLCGRNAGEKPVRRAWESPSSSGLLGLAGTCPPLLLSQRLALAPPRPCWGGPTPGNKDGAGREACPREATHQRPCLRESAADSGLRPRCASPSLKHSSCAPRALPRWSHVRLHHGLCGAGPGPPRRPCGLGQVTSPAQHQLPAL